MKSVARMSKKPTQEELIELKNQFFKSINDYLDHCIAHKDIRRMQRFIASVRDILKREASGQD